VLEDARPVRSRCLSGLGQRAAAGPQTLVRPLSEHCAADTGALADGLELRGLVWTRERVLGDFGCLRQRSAMQQLPWQTAAVKLTRPHRASRSWDRRTTACTWNLSWSATCDGATNKALQFECSAMRVRLLPVRRGRVLPAGARGQPADERCKPCSCNACSRDRIAGPCMHASAHGVYV